MAADYLGEISFLAVSGKSSFDAAAARASQLFSDNIAWGHDDSLWQLYGVLGQPYTVVIAPGNVIADSWFGTLGEVELRQRLDVLLARV